MVRTSLKAYLPLKSSLPSIDPTRGALNASRLGRYRVSSLALAKLGWHFAAEWRRGGRERFGTCRMNQGCNGTDRANASWFVTFRLRVEALGCAWRWPTPPTPPIDSGRSRQHRNPTSDDCDADSENDQCDSMLWSRAKTSSYFVTPWF